MTPHLRLVVSNRPLHVLPGWQIVHCPVCPYAAGAPTQDRALQKVETHIRDQHCQVFGQPQGAA